MHIKITRARLKIQKRNMLVLERKFDHAASNADRCLTHWEALSTIAQ